MRPKDTKIHEVLVGEHDPLVFSSGKVVIRASEEPLLDNDTATRFAPFMIIAAGGLGVISLFTLQRHKKRLVYLGGEQELQEVSIAYRDNDVEAEQGGTGGKLT